MTTIFTIVAVVFIFSFLIFIHEFGHFFTAKLSGVRVNEFSMFMGPAIFKKQVGETLYSLRCIPIGGYCAMEGEDDDTDDPRSFRKAAWWKRLIILVAGSFMNFVAGLLILALLYAPAQQFLVPVIDSFAEYCTVNGENGLQVGDRFVEVDGEKIYLQSDFSLILGLNENEENKHDIVVERNGELVYLNDFVLERHEITNEDGTTSNLIGFSFVVEDFTFADKLAYTWYTAVDWVRSIRLSLQMLVTGKATLTDLTGPVGIGQQMVEIAQDSATWLVAAQNLLYFGAFIAVNLAIMNLLPIPALDGGRVVALLLTTAVEAIIRRKINPKYEGYIHAVGMILLLALMAIIMFKDIIFIFI